MLFLIGATFNWFGHAKLQRIRIGVIWLLLSIAGLWIGGFGLPWNALLHLTPPNASTPDARIGELWALLLISATLLAISGLSKARSSLTTRNENAEVRRVLNIRPSLIWIVVLVAMLWFSGLGRDATAATVALIACGAMWLRMWLEGSPRETRLLHRRIVLAVIAVGVLLLWQRGALGGWSESFTIWRDDWNEAWSEMWWSAAMLALLALVFAFTFTSAREVLRSYLAPRYSLRAMLGGTALASLAGLLIYGPAAPPLLATFTLGAIAHEILARDVLGEASTH
jgi:succinate dehydrogenase hydrophobic anchor subunit